VCLNRIRADRVRHSPQIDQLLSGIADKKSASHEATIDDSLFLDYLFMDVPEGTRCMATLHYLDGLTLEQTAQEMEMSVSGVRKRLVGLRKKALQCIGGLR
jgi:RNA polymerase sigma-70 factor (ECF subfamily)